MIRNNFHPCIHALPVFESSVKEMYAMMTAVQYFRICAILSFDLDAFLKEAIGDWKLTFL